MKPSTEPAFLPLTVALILSHSVSMLMLCRAVSARTDVKTTEAFCLILAGTVFDLSTLVKGKFRNRGHKEALKAMRALEDKGLRKPEEMCSKESVKVCNVHCE